MPAALLALALPAQANTWLFAPGGSAVDPIGSGFGNGLQFLQDDDLLTATAWYEFNSNNPKFRDANLGQFGAGLGACNQKEGNRCYADGLADPIDNLGEREWLLLQLDGNWGFDSLRVTPADAQASLGLTYWIGTLGQNASLDGIGYAGLAGLGFGTQVDVSLAAGQMMEMALNSVLGNSLLIGASRSGGGDAFYLDSVTASLSVAGPESVVPLPPSAWMFGAALGLLGWLRKHTREPIA